jgi:cytochrome c
MRNTTLIAVGIISSFYLFINSNAYAANGATLYKAKACQTCHGADGKTPLQPTYPKLAGQNAEYLVQQIKDIRDGKRDNALSRTMKPLVGNLRDPEIKAIAEWLAGLPK